TRRETLRRVQLRRLSWRRGGGGGGSEPGRRPLALRRRGRRGVSLDLLRPAPRHARVRRDPPARRDLEGGDVPAVPPAGGGSCYGFLEPIEERQRPALQWSVKLQAASGSQPGDAGYS